MPRNIAVRFWAGRRELFILFKNFIPFFSLFEMVFGNAGIEGETPFPAQRHAKAFQFLFWLYVQLYRGGGEMDGSGESLVKAGTFLPRNRNWNFLKKSGSVFFFSLSLLFNIHSTFESLYCRGFVKHWGGGGRSENSIVILCACQRHTPPK